MQQLLNTFARSRNKVLCRKLYKDKDSLLKGQFFCSKVETRLTELKTISLVCSRAISDFGTFALLFESRIRPRSRSFKTEPALRTEEEKSLVCFLGFDSAEFRPEKRGERRREEREERDGHDVLAWTASDTGWAENLHAFFLGLIYCYTLGRKCRGEFEGGCRICEVLVRI